MLKNKFKILFILILILTNISNVFSQRKLKYKDVYKVILEGDKDKAYTMLLAFQKQDPEFANTYFQLSLLAIDRAKKYYPLTELENVKYFTYNSKLFLGLAKLKVKDDKRSNRSYYENAEIEKVDGKIKFEKIDTFLTVKNEDITEYEKNVIETTDFFHKSSEKYNECIRIFKNINGKFSKIKNVYLSETPELNTQLTYLEMSFDSCLFYFKEYKDNLADYPLKDYKQQYKLKIIITYRLDGLTGANFLENQIVLWDYKTWVNQVRKTINTDIKNNRDKIVETNNLIDNKIRELSEERYSDDYKGQKIDKKFIYKIEKYDNKSLLISLLKYKQSLIEFLLKYRKTINNPNDKKDFSLRSKVLYYKSLTDRKIISDSLNILFRNRVSDSEILKNKSFFESKYNDSTGLKSYSVSQDKFLKNTLKNGYNNLKISLSKFLKSAHDTVNLLYNNKQIPKEKSIPLFNNAEEEKFYTTHYDRNTTGELYITGYTKTSSGKTAAFIAYKPKGDNINFLKKIKISDESNDCGLIIKAVEKACFVIVNSETETGKMNTLFKINNTGKVELRKELPFKKIPRYIKFDDINNNLQIIFKGNNYYTQDDDPAQQILFNLNLTDDSKTYKTEQKIRGNIFEIIKMDKNTFIFNNFISYEDTNGERIVSGAGIGNTNIFLTIIDETGKIIKKVSYSKQKPYFGIKAVKISSNTINILGLKSRQSKFDNNLINKSNLFYSIINLQGEETYSNWHD